MSTDQKGAIAETAIAAHATRMGIEVYRPLAEGGRFDLIFAVRSQLLRIQAKWAPRVGDVIQVRAYSARRTLNGMVNRRYTADEVDAIVAYCPDLDRCYFLPVAMIEHHRVLHLRVGAPRNGQQARINWATDFELGAVAQIGQSDALAARRSRVRVPPAPLPSQAHQVPAAGPAAPPGLTTSRRLEALSLIAAERRRRGWSQEFVAARMNSPHSTLSRFERGVGEPRLATLDRYAAALGYVVQHHLHPCDRAAHEPPVVVHHAQPTTTSTGADVPTPLSLSASVRATSR